MKTTRQTQIKLLVAAVFCISLLPAVTAPAVAVEYEYTELLLPSGWENIYPVAINDNGVVAGWGVDETPLVVGFKYKDGEYEKIMLPNFI
jgi:hypothetical protein